MTGRWALRAYAVSIFTTICAGMFAAVSWLAADLQSAGIAGAVAGFAATAWGAFEYCAERDRERVARWETGR